MKTSQLITALKQCNCRKLSQLSSINIRTIYRIRDAETKPLAETIERLEPHLKAARRHVVRAEKEES